MENKEYGQVIGSRSAPYLNQLAQRYASATGVHALRHPSLPNYLALIGGSTHGIRSDCTGCSVGGGTIVQQMRRKGVSWHGYFEDMPRNCFGGVKYRGYVKKHNPFIYYRSIAHSRRYCNHLLAGRRLNLDLRHRSNLADFNWITPSQCHNTHDCGVRQGDRYLRKIVPRLLRRTGPHGFVMVTYDEGTTSAGFGSAHGGHIPTVLAGPAVRSEFRENTKYDTYSLLGMFEDVFGLGRLGQANCRCKGTMEDFFSPPRAVRLRGSAVRTVNRFSLRWGSVGGGLDPVRAHVSLCPEQGGHCSVFARIVRHRNLGLDRIRVPAIGVYRATVWLEDRFGNTSPSNASNAVTLTLRAP
jgi:hypothetical protein